MKILYTDHTGQLGGGELSLLEVIKQNPGNAEVALFADGPFRKSIEALGVPVHLFSLGKANDIRREANLASVLAGAPAMWKLRSELRVLAKRFDVIYSNSQKAFLISCLARRKGQALVWHLRDMLTGDHFSPQMRRAAVLAGNHSASAIIANSEATRNSFQEAGGRGDRTFVVYNGIDPGPYQAVDDAAVEQIRESLGLKGKFVLGVFGRITEWKAQHVVIEALKQLPDVHAIIVGEALFGEQAYASELRSRAQALGVDNRVHFMGFRSDIPTLMKVTSAIVHSSIAPEPFGRVIVEAMLAERPVIATRAGGALEIVVDGQTGLLVEPGSVQELQNAIIRLMQDPALALRLASEGRRRAVQVFSVDAMMAGIQRVLSTLDI